MGESFHGLDPRGEELVTVAYEIAMQFALIRRELDSIDESLPMAGRGYRGNASETWSGTLEDEPDGRAVEGERCDGHPHLRRSGAVGIRKLPERAGLFRCQPVTKSNTQLLGSLDAATCGRKFWAQQPESAALMLLSALVSGRPPP
jgi:hypothetical protein